jgi:hypothetical protein
MPFDTRNNQENRQTKRSNSKSKLHHPNQCIYVYVYFQIMIGIYSLPHHLLSSWTTINHSITFFIVLYQQFIFWPIDPVYTFSISFFYFLQLLIVVLSFSLSLWFSLTVQSTVRKIVSRIVGITPKTSLCCSKFTIGWQRNQKKISSNQQIYQVTQTHTHTFTHTNKAKARTIANIRNWKWQINSQDVVCRPMRSEGTLKPILIKFGAHSARHFRPFRWDHNRKTIRILYGDVKIFRSDFDTRATRDIKIWFFQIYLYLN